MSAFVQTPREDKDIRICALPAGKVVAIAKAIRVDGTTIFLGQDGSIYCPRVTNGMYYSLHDWNFLAPLLSGLVKLGVITETQAKEHKALAAKNSKELSAAHDLARLDEIAKDYGLKLPTREREKLRKAAGIKKAGVSR